MIIALTIMHCSQLCYIEILRSEDPVINDRLEDELKSKTDWIHSLGRYPCSD